ncbi:hypothetical protein VTK73DRAFT_5897 [Phialemonium thermophilum]|uniref:Uncharacterized protein n=1 Tax=Phialemonium thermophilum TaxID=223376 RepID=A0ABR3WLL5_9PEZI
MATINEDGTVIQDAVWKGCSVSLGDFEPVQAGYDTCSTPTDILRADTCDLHPRTRAFLFPQSRLVINVISKQRGEQGLEYSRE